MNEYYVISIDCTGGDYESAPTYFERTIFESFDDAQKYIPTVLSELEDNYGEYVMDPSEETEFQDEDDECQIGELYFPDNDNMEFSSMISIIKVKVHEKKKSKKKTKPIQKTIK